MIWNTSARLLLMNENENDHHKMLTITLLTPPAIKQKCKWFGEGHTKTTRDSGAEQVEFKDL